MGMFDQFKEVAEKAKDLAAQHADKIDPLIEKAGDIVDEKTDGKFAGQVDSVQDAARKALREQ
ncbi:antitoxin [Nocardia pseudobrasiliensis]|uniref:Antitoxin protein of toxin-antitoxin system n=1 Tax=Nocardia pseudobrasiliensis TaxID=45979 RepID=A0A370I6E9_9NOCA|nr:antitoxin [Nocardia pseudobrasiliensis]RDI66313.1 antitoxin protein of toxin-antitoxin system [Nocardia pseudobrasiliensis]